jgi:capsular exopolysaccharide synthesis family protein
MERPAVRKANGFNLVDCFDQESSYATEFRRLLHNINGAVPDKKARSIMATSALLAEGKSTVVSFLGLTAARLKHRRTLLIDCDLRRPTLHMLFSVPRNGGVVETVREGKKIKDVVKRTAEPNLDIITSGMTVSQPSEIFESGRIRELLDEARFYYELILVDCAPVLPVSDPMLLAPEMDGVILIVKAGSTQREIARRASEVLKNERSRFLGVVLNNLSNALPYYYSDSYYGYEYKPNSTKD